MLLMMLYGKPTFGKKLRLREGGTEGGNGHAESIPFSTVKLRNNWFVFVEILLLYPFFKFHVA